MEAGRMCHLPMYIGIYGIVTLFISIIFYSNFQIICVVVLPFIMTWTLFSVLILNQEILIAKILLFITLLNLLIFSIPIAYLTPLAVSLAMLMFFTQPLSVILASMHFSFMAFLAVAGVLFFIGHIVALWLSIRVIVDNRNLRKDTNPLLL
jgi:hypothetical protein